MVLCEMVKGDFMGSTGYGISPYITDNEYDIIEVSCEHQKITIGTSSWTFDEYCKLDNPEQYMPYK
jgi:hypothetical protein